MIGSNMYQQEMLAKLRQQELQQLAATRRLSRQARLHPTLLQRIVVWVGAALIWSGRSLQRMGHSVECSAPETDTATRSGQPGHHSGTWDYHLN